MESFLELALGRTGTGPMINIFSSQSPTELDLETRQRSRKNSTQASNNNQRISVLENKVKQLELTNEALWELLKSHETLGTILSEGSLKAKIEDIAQQKEQMKNAKAQCHNCGLQFPQSRDNCFYCGTEKLSEPAKNIFDFE